MSDKRSDDPSLRRCQRVLAMVHELHKRGYQRLRIMPGMSPSGAHWRVNITPKSNILRSHGAMALDFDRQSAHYTSADSNTYFGWQDAQGDTARDLAAKFLERFPELAAAGQGSDWEYAGWYVEMLGMAEKGALPISYDDWYSKPPTNRLTTTNSGILIPMPPPGEAADSSRE